MGDTPKLLEWYRKQFFEKESAQESVQSELSTFFDVDEAIEGAMKKGEKNWDNSPLSQRMSLNEIKDIWRDNLKKHSSNIDGFDVDSAIDDNVKKGINELDDLRGLSSGGQERVDLRVDKLIDKSKTIELIYLKPLGFRNQEKVNTKIRSVGSSITREEINATNLSSIRRLADRIGLSIDGAKDVLRREGFELKRNETIF